MLPLLLALCCLGTFAFFVFRFISKNFQTEDGNAVPARNELHHIPPRPVNRMQAGLRRRRQRRTSESEDEEEAPEEHQQEDPKNFRKDAYNASRAARDAEREALEAAQEAEIRRAAEERAKREEEEAAQWMSSFKVEDAGEEALPNEEIEAQFHRMEAFLKNRKIVALEEMAAEFKMRIADVIEKVRMLETLGRITGVMDERGKYIYISLEEMHAVADYIKAEGRVGIRELAMYSSRLIDLEPKAIHSPAS